MALPKVGPPVRASTICKSRKLGEAYKSRETRIAARKVLSLNCRAITLAAKAVLEEEVKPTLKGRGNCGHILWDIWAGVVASQKLPRDSGESSLAAKHSDVSQGPVGNPCNTVLPWKAVVHSWGWPISLVSLLLTFCVRRILVSKFYSAECWAFGSFLANLSWRLASQKFIIKIWRGQSLFLVMLNSSSLTLAMITQLLLQSSFVIVLAAMVFGFLACLRMQEIVSDDSSDGIAPWRCFQH